MDSSGTERALEISFLTLFPEIFPPLLSFSLMGKAARSGKVQFEVISIRDFATDRHRTVDDTPFGGGPGMVLRADVLYSAWKKAGGMRPAPAGTATLLLSPQGRRFDQQMAKELSRYRRLILVCGHYEGVDERFIDLCVDQEVSVGDYVLTGGELPALLIADAVTRLLPGVVGNEQSLSEDSLEDHLLKYPQYTRPREFMGLEVPSILLGGNHQAIADWRKAQKLERTRRKRPDLLNEKPS